MIFFRKRIRRLVNPDETEKRLREEGLDLEKGDLKAILLSALAVFLPVVLGIAAVLLGIAYLLSL
ncbi:MAG: hypothetical protein LBR72_08155 [Oscillospiraceae bacterium]|jgi:hypothetical protein|nr:hypothetical protein [Oscillospiraceae bacterium]